MPTKYDTDTVLDIRDELASLLEKASGNQFGSLSKEQSEKVAEALLREGLIDLDALWARTLAPKPAPRKKAGD